jgi:hypothetical protein
MTPHDPERPTDDIARNPETQPQEGERAASTSETVPGADETELEEDPKPTKKGILKELQAAIANGQQNRDLGRRQNRNAKAQNRSAGLLIITAAVIAIGFVLVATFSHSNNQPRGEGKRTKPSLGRPEKPAPSTGPSRGSATPLQQADLSDQEGAGDQVSAEDIRQTARPRYSPPPSQPRPTLANVPPMNDPALDEYRARRQNTAAATPPPSPAPPAAPVAVVANGANQQRAETDALKKPSLVYVRNGGSPDGIRLASLGREAGPVVLEQRRGTGLPTGSRLVARLQSAVSSAVATPVVAAIEYNYERDGEIVMPAGTKAYGELQQANRNGIVALRFRSLELPDGSTEKIEATAESLEYGPLKGSVNGADTAKRVLVRTLTGVGAVAAYLVGGPGGFSGASGQLDNSILLRERIASNAGLAGDQELTNLAANQNIVITVAANTRFFIVLSTGTEGGEQRTPTRLSPAVTQPGTLRAGADSALPSARELQQLVDLKRELNRLYTTVTAGRNSESTAEAAPAEPAEQ